MTAHQSHRLDTGGRIAREQLRRFQFDGRELTGYAGDTLASALLANGVRLVGRSFKYHRPRGIYSAGPEEPNALVRLGQGARHEPNSRATMVELTDGLCATSQNRWPTLALDWRAVQQRFAALMPAGFYYKTFMWPAKWWPAYEHQIRRAAGLGLPPLAPDPDRYAFEYAFCDVLVVGAGPAGLSAALAAARSGARVVLADERAELGGSALWERDTIDGLAAADWVQRMVAELAALPNMRLLPRSTVFGHYDHQLLAIAQRVTEHLADAPQHDLPRQRLIHLRAGRVVLASGSIERPLVFADNDRPGVMLAGAIRTYVNQYAVLPGRRAVVFTNHDEAYRSAFDLHAAGAASVTVVDTRATIAPALRQRLGEARITLHTDARIGAVAGRAVRSVDVVRRDGSRIARLPCDLLGSSGGWSPTVHLFSQAGGKLRFDEGIQGFVPLSGVAAMDVVGAANGDFTLAQALADGAAAGRNAALGAMPAPRRVAMPEPAGLPGPAAADDLLASTASGKCFVDIQDDVTVDDIALAHRENFRSVEHLKRYTTLGMGTDQGKTSNVNGLAIMAALRKEAVGVVGTTTFRPPYTPVTLGLFAGAEVGRHQTPVRRTPLHDWHGTHGAVMAPVGQWMRPKAYCRPDESFDAAWRRESLAVRNAVGLVDVGTLGKIDLQGPDVMEFIQRVYCNNFANLGVGRLRYGLMLREDGLVMDDGTVARLSETHCVVTTTTAHAGKVQSAFEWLLQVAWPELRCHAVSVTEQFAQCALAGPASRAVLAKLLPHCDVSDAGLPHLGVLQTTRDGVPLTAYRMSFSGERAYELAIGADHGVALWERLLVCGADEGITPYGTEAMAVLRIEKGHVAGGELDGRMTAADLGLGRLPRKDGKFVGAALARRAGLADPLRPSLVGLVPVDGHTPIPGGSVLVADEAQARVAADVDKHGFVTSTAVSPFLGHPIALGFLRDGAARIGDILLAAAPLSGSSVRVRVTAPVFVDPGHKRLKD